MKKVRLTSQETASFCRDMELLRHAGLPLADCLYLLAEEEKGQPKEAYKQMGMLLDQAEPLSAAMEKSGLFPACATGMVQVGEHTGRLEEALHMLAAYYETLHRASTHLRNAITYPMVLLAVMLAVITVLLVQVLPVFAQVYASLGSQLSGVSAFLLQLGQAIAKLLPVLLPAAVLILAVVAVVLTVPAAQKKAAMLWQHRWGDRGVFRKYNNALFAKALAMAFGSGLPLSEAVLLARRLLEDRPGTVERIDRCAKQLEKGAPAQEAMADGELLNPAGCRMLSVGLRGGNGEQVMEEIARQMMEEAQTAMESKISRLEPAMVLVCSVLVGGILLCVMLPLIHILSAIG